MKLTLFLVVYIPVLIKQVIALELGQSCSSNEQCNITNSVCLSGACKCLANTIDDNGDYNGGSCRNKSDFASQNIHVDEIGVNHLKISWTDPVAVNLVSYFAVTHTEVLTGHTVTQNVTKTYTTVSTGCNINQQVFTAVLNGLNKATNYKILIESVLSFGGVVGAEIYQYTKPSGPGNVTATNIAPTIDISWTDNAVAVTVHYSVQVKLNNTLLTNKTTFGKTISISGLQAGETYDIWVYAVAAGIQSEPTVTVVKTIPIPPDPPEELRYDRRSSTQVILHWLEPNNTYGIVDYYWIHVELEKVLTGTVIETTFKATSWNFHGINTTKDYCFMVYSHNTGGYNSTHPSTVCLIDSEPPVITFCPKQITAYADKASSTTSVTWSIPTATDNSRKPVIISQTAGQPPSSRFSIGVHYVSYQAEDEVGNIAPDCYFYVNVKAINCLQPSFEDKYIKYTCPSGYQYGFSCTLSCIGDFEIIGAKRMICDARDTSSSHVNNVVWIFQSQLQEPVCNGTEKQDTNHSTCPGCQGLLAATIVLSILAAVVLLILLAVIIRKVC